MINLLAQPAPDPYAHTHWLLLLLSVSCSYCFVYYVVVKLPNAVNKHQKELDTKKPAPTEAKKAKSIESSLIKYN